MGMKLFIDETPIANDAAANRLAQDMDANPPDGLLIVMFYNGSLKQADLLLAAADKSGIPAIFFIGLGVKHGPVTAYRRPGVYFIQALDDLNAIENGLRMINAKKITISGSSVSIRLSQRLNTRFFPLAGSFFCPFRTSRANSGVL